MTSQGITQSNVLAFLKMDDIKRLRDHSKCTIFLCSSIHSHALIADREQFGV